MLNSRVGVLAYGSLRDDPGAELVPLIARRIATTTPFNVEFARISAKRGGAATVCPFDSGEPVPAEVLVLRQEVTVPEATDLVWRRETGNQGTDRVYPGGNGRNAVVVKNHRGWAGVSSVLYADFNEDGKIPTHLLSPEFLANAAIRSVTNVDEYGADAVTYLLNFIQQGAHTRLSPAYLEEILRKTGASTLEESLARLQMGRGLGKSFIGIDLAWNIEENHSSVVVLKGDENGVRFGAASYDLHSLKGIKAFVQRHLADTSVVAADVPLVVKNPLGQRPCETQLGRKFGVYGASANTMNQANKWWQSGERLVSALARIGFERDFDLKRAKRRQGSWIFEVYPHPAMIQLFGLNEIIRYKKGLIGDKRDGLRTLSRRIRSLPQLELTRGLADILNTDIEALNGARLKHHEDKLDALFCAYLAWHCWKWGEEQNEMLGTARDGYIVVPKRHNETSRQD